MSVDFGGSQNQASFAAITINSSTPGTVPEPATWAMIGGLGLVGATMRRRAVKRASVIRRLFRVAIP